MGTSGLESENASRDGRLIPGPANSAGQTGQGKGELGAQLGGQGYQGVNQHLGGSSSAVTLGRLQRG